VLLEQAPLFCGARTQQFLVCTSRALIQVKAEELPRRHCQRKRNCREKSSSVKDGSGASALDSYDTWPNEADGQQMEALPAAIMKRAHFEKLRLCEALEEIGDSLPDDVDRLKCLGIANLLVPLLRDVHRYEEKVIFPAYEMATGRGSEDSTIRRLLAEHVEDECFAGEVTEVLLAIGHGGAITNADAVGFMLRGMFETLRRHIAFEREHVLPLIGAS
jgi:hemerythrin-like domain-containing protein